MTDFLPPAAEAGFELTQEQIHLIEKANPCFRERHVESEHPGQLLSLDTFYVRHLKGVGRFYLQAVVDAFGRLAFGKLYTRKKPETAVDVLYDLVIPYLPAAWRPHRGPPDRERHGIQGTADDPPP